MVDATPGALRAASNPLGGFADGLSSAAIALVLSETRLPAMKCRLSAAANLLSSAASLL